MEFSSDQGLRPLAVQILQQVQFTVPSLGLPNHSPGGIGILSGLFSTSAVALGVGYGGTKTHAPAVHSWLISQGYRTYCRWAGHPEKEQMHPIFTWLFPCSLFLVPISAWCYPSSLCGKVLLELSKKPHPYGGAACVRCRSGGTRGGSLSSHSRVLLFTDTGL